MRMTYVVHILADSLGLISGYVALSAAKGATLHRKSGTVFVYAMLTMCFFGALIAAVRRVGGGEHPCGGADGLSGDHRADHGPPPVEGSRWLHLGLMLVALAIGLTSLTFGFEALAAGGKGTGSRLFRCSCLV